VKSVLCYFWDEVKSPALTSRVRCLSAGRQGSSLVQKIASSAWFFLQFVAPGCCIALSSNLPTVQISWPGLSPQCSVTEATTVLLWGTRRKLLCRSAALNMPGVRKHPPFRGVLLGVFVYLSMIWKPQQWGCLNPHWAVVPQKVK
jgi:hypothetical protein